MVNLTRICIPLSLDCNLHCRYCYRNKEKLDKIPEFNQKMIDYLRQLTPDRTEAVIASGGEPLLHWDKVKELFSYVLKNVHKKILSNGTLLTQEIVDYINKNEIELLISHDGPQTEFLRGVDVLKNKKLKHLIQQVKILTLSCVVTKFNTNIWENYFDSIKKLGRVDIKYLPIVVEDVVPEMHYLVDGFNYDEWFNTYLQFTVSPFNLDFPWYGGKTIKGYKPRLGRTVGFNILPDGIVTGMIHIRSVYGDIFENTAEECIKNGHKTGLLDYCIKTKCKYADRCNTTLQHTSPHICRGKQIYMDRWNEKSFNEAKEYVNEYLDDIIIKYFPDFADIYKEKK